MIPRKHREIWPVLTSVVGPLLTVGVALATVSGYHKDVLAAPDYGNWWWWNDVTWETDVWWSRASIDALRDAWLHGGQFDLEVEAYNPGNNTSCDRLHLTEVHPETLPVADWTPGNGCGSASYQEELKLHLNEGYVDPETWYQPWYRFARISYQSGEVNFSFAQPGTLAPDDWLAKLTYDSNFNKTGDDPAGITN